MIKIKMNLVNKVEYMENEDYREIVIVIPKETEKLKRDLEYLGLDYENLAIQDTHITNIEIIDKENDYVARKLTKEIMNINTRSFENGYTMPFNYIKTFYDQIKNFNELEKVKLLVILQTQKENISHVKDMIKYTDKLDAFELDDEVYSPEEYARKMVHYSELYMEDVFDYIDFQTLGKDLLHEKNSIVTEYGILNIVDESILKEEEEEEFE